MLRAYTHWDFPKGMVEDDESPFDAARREVQEETTLNGLQFYWGHEYYETPPYNRGKVARYYLAESHAGEVELPVNPELGRPEHEEFRWVNRSDALELVSARVQPVLDWAQIRLTAGDGSAGSRR